MSHNISYGPPLTYGDLANDRGDQSRTKSLDFIVDWALAQKDKYYEHPEDGTIHRIVPINS